MAGIAVRNGALHSRRHGPALACGHETDVKATDVKRPVTAFVLALVSVILSPVLFIFELSALFFAGMVTYEPANSIIVKILSIALVIVIGLLALIVPVIALILGIRARAAAKTGSTGGGGLATAAAVIAGIVTAGVLAGQVYLILMVVGSCSLEGC